MFETSTQRQAGEEYVSSRDEAAIAGIVLFDALARFKAGETKSGLRCLQYLQQSRSLVALIDTLCPGLSTRSDRRSRRIRSLIGESPAALPDGEAAMAKSAAPGWLEEIKFPRAVQAAASELTLRQHAALKLVLDGCTNAEIARRLLISKNTVKWHLKLIFRLLGVENRCSALKVAKARDLI